MDNITLIEVEIAGEIQTHVVIDKGNGEFTSMRKSIYDEMLKQQTAE